MNGMTITKLLAGCTVAFIMGVVSRQLLDSHINARNAELNRQVEYLKKDVLYLQEQVDKLSVESGNISSRLEVLGVRMKHASTSLIVSGKMTTKLGEDIRKAMMDVEEPGDEPVTVIGESPDAGEQEKDQDGNVIFPNYTRMPETNSVP